MRDEELRAVFDQQAAGYDKQWAKLAPIRDALHFLLESVFAELPADAKVLCVGAGTGAELVHLASRFPGWRFTVVEPAGAMLAQCRARAEAGGFASRCRFHDGYVESLDDALLHDAATSFLVSQFILDRDARIAYFASIAKRMRPSGVLATADLASDASSTAHEPRVRAWMSMMSAAGMAPEALARMREAWAKDVSILPPTEVASLIEAGGFETAVSFHQAGLIHAWFARRA